jgi:hypothetical protein
MIPCKHDTSDSLGKYFKGNCSSLVPTFFFAIQKFQPYRSILSIPEISSN